MDEQGTLAEILARYLEARGYTGAGLARASGVPKQTIDRWLRGQVGRPYFGDQLLRVAAALGLTAVRAERLLRAAGQPPLAVWRARATEKAERDLLARWATAAPHNLPAPLTGFVGRDAEVLDVGELLCRPDVRLVTLTGPGGSGKTRLALEVARALFDAFPDGVYFVPLAPITDPALVLPAIAQALGVREAPGEPLRARLVAALGARRLLLLLDNLEQVVEAGPEIAALLMAAPRLAVLATSRVRLHVSGEHEWPVPPLPLPGDETDFAALAANPAVALFVARARAADPAFRLTAANAATVAALCARLDGLPLALELAAARARRFSPAELLARFPGRLALAADGPRDVAARQRTLRDAIAWSHDLLGPDEQILFARLAVFAGGWTRVAAEAVCQDAAGRPPDAAGGLARLAEAHLIEPAGGDDADPRYAMLETIREYALERLAASGEGEAVRERHAAHSLALARTFPYSVSGYPEPAYRAKLDRLDAERDNFRAALAWALARPDGEPAARLTGALWPFWLERAALAEGDRWLAAALAQGAGLPADLRAPLLTGAFLLAYLAGDYGRAEALGARALALWRALGDRRGQAVVLLFQGLTGLYHEGFAAAKARFRASLALWRALGDRRGVARCLNELAMAAGGHGRFAEAERHFAAAEALYARLGDRVGLARAAVDRGVTAMFRGDLAGARALLERGVALGRELRNHATVAHGLCYLGATTLFAGEPVAARGYLRESLRLRRESGDRLGTFHCLLGLAGAAGRLGEADRAVRLCGAATALLEAMGGVMLPAVRALYEREVGALRAELGEAAFAEAWAAGRALPLAAAIAEALGERPP